MALRMRRLRLVHLPTRLPSQVWCFGLVICCASSRATATPPHLSEAYPAVARPAEERTATTKTPDGRPDVHLDRLDFPSDVPRSAALKGHLKRVLEKEVRRVEWGAGRDNRIEYRFSVTKLELSVNSGVLQVACSAVGSLPGGRTAKSQLTFGGAANERDRVIKQVLEIVARGVIARLAQLERRRRGLD